MNVASQFFRNFASPYLAENPQVLDEVRAQIQLDEANASNSDHSGAGNDDDGENED